jgi:hypothetical protein
MDLDKISFKEARGRMWEAFLEDDEFREVYIATIACILMDAQSSCGERLDFHDHTVRNALAEKIFTHLYGESE